MKAKLCLSLLCCGIVFSLLAPTPAQEAQAEAEAEAVVEWEPLPQWSQDDLTKIEKGENLISGELFDIAEAQEQPAEALDLPLPGPEIVDDTPSTDIPETALAAYAQSDPLAWLIDPQKILSQQQFLDAENFLQYHSGVSKIDIHVYLFDRDQIIPASLERSALIAKHAKKDRETAVIFYFYESPERTEMNFGEATRRKIGDFERKRCLVSSIQAAVGKSQPEDQLEGLCVQMSIMLYRLEKALKQGIDLTAADTLTNQNEQQGKASPFAKAIQLWGTTQSYRLRVASALLLIGMAWIIFAVRRSRRSYTFEEFDIPPRLGGDHGAGVGAVISYLPYERKRKNSDRG
jgi:hypothetical protein